MKKKDFYKMIDLIKNTIRKLKELDSETLEVYNYVLFGVIIADIFGIWWYLGWKTIGGSILIVCAVILSILLILKKRRFDIEDKEVNKMGKYDEEIAKKERELKDLKEKNKKSEELPKNTEKNDSERLNEGIDNDFGLPDANEYNERVKKALGTEDFGF